MFEKLSFQKSNYSARNFLLLHVRIKVVGLNFEVSKMPSIYKLIKMINGLYSKIIFKTITATNQSLIFHFSPIYILFFIHENRKI